MFVFDDGDGADTSPISPTVRQVRPDRGGRVDEFSDLAVIDNGATVTVDYGTGSFTLANVDIPRSTRATSSSLDGTRFHFTIIVHADRN